MKNIFCIFAVVAFTGLVYYVYENIYHPSISGRFIVSSYDNEGIIDKTVEADSIDFDPVDKTWSCRDVNTNKKYIFDTNIIIENIDK